jgi:hypothetical protein
MAYQTQSNAIVAYKAQTGLGVPATGTGAQVLRVAGGTGGDLTKAATESNEVRYDGMRTRGRHGIQKTTGAWSGEASLGSFDIIAEAIMRDTMSAADLTITEVTAGLTSITTTAYVAGTNTPATIVATAGSWITAGLKVGDIIRLTGHSATGNNNRNMRITGLTPTTITIGEQWLAAAAADAAFSIIRPGKKLIQSGTQLIKRYFTVEEYEIDIDQSMVMSDFVWGAMRVGMAPNGIITMDPSGIGTGQMSVNDTATSPVFTTPTPTTSLPLAVVDATIRIGGRDMVDLTSFDLTMDISPMSPDVFGSGNIKYGPDVFTGQMGIGINFTALRKDLQMLQDFIAETQYSISILAVENEAEPKSFLSIYVPNLTLGGLTKSAYAKEGGPRTQSVTVPMALIGKDVTSPETDGTMIKIQSSAT